MLPFLINIADRIRIRCRGIPKAGVKGNVMRGQKECILSLSDWPASRAVDMTLEQLLCSGNIYVPKPSLQGFARVGKRHNTEQDLELGKRWHNSRYLQTTRGQAGQDAAYLVNVAVCDIQIKLNLVGVDAEYFPQAAEKQLQVVVLVVGDR
jgi:hypothetical protein